VRSDELVVAALRAGATGFLGKGPNPNNPCRPCVLLRRRIAAVPGPHQPHRQRRGPTRATRANNELPRHRTDREIEITTLVGQGLSNAEIAGKLFISPATTKTDVNRAMMKTGARDRAQLVIFAYEHHLIS